MNFRELGLIDPILRALNEQGYHDPTPIQRKAIPPALAGRDVLGCAQTGTGKTCAFAAPILQRLNGRNGNPRKIRALVLTPTRELALQIQESFAAYGQHLSLRSAVIFGGVGQQPQVDKLKKGVDILVATPGRLLDLHGQDLLDLSQVEIFVLDEADRMLDMGFIHDVRRVLKVLPEKKQTLFFSATMPPEVMELVNALLRNYVRVAVDPVSSPVEIIRQFLYFVDKPNKTKLLAHLIQEKGMDSVLVFSRTKHGANRIAQDLIKRGIAAAAIHGNKSQSARVQALADFKAGRITALIATDIAARGIDIDELNWVVNYDLPEVPETYVHRIGRTGRAGRGGSALSFCRADERDYLKQIEKLLGKSLPVVEKHPFPMTEAATGVDPMTQARREGKENARQARAERERAAKAKTEKAAGRDAQGAPPAKAPAVSDTRRTAVRPDEGAARRGQASGAGRAEGEAVGPRDAFPAQPGAKSPRKRGVRQGDLSAMQPERPAQPVVDFVKPNPLDSDVVMDATARLLAPRTTRLFSPPVRAKPSAPPPDREGSKKEERGSVAGSKRRRKKHGGKKTQNAPKEAAAPAVELPQPKKAAGAPAPAPKGRGKGRGGRQRNEPPRRDRQKDSAELTGSVMKPYYLSDN